jgi:bifunctional DNA-binding transcriptional regulator/antitoxin component of YhaV-PrlF toxin-antitoxin module
MPDGDSLKVTIQVAGGGDVTLPKAICDRHGWTAATVLEIVDGSRGIVLQPPQARLFPQTRLEDVAGSLIYDGPPISIGDMHKAIENEVRRQHARGRY